jgi:hypothetical protein
MGAVIIKPPVIDRNNEACNAGLIFRGLEVDWFSGAVAYLIGSGELRTCESPR